MSWIKMRIELQTHPKVVRILSAMRPQSVRSATDKFWVIGGLHAVWCVFDTHSEDGVLVGYTPEALDHVIGLPGIADAMMEVGWLEYDGAQTLTLPEFDEHNSQSAKRRAEDQKRKKAARKSSPRPQTVHKLSTNEPDISRKNCGPEKEKEEELTTHTPGRAAQISIAMRKHTIDANPAHPVVLAIAGQDVAIETIEACCKEARDAKPNERISPNYIAKKLEGWANAAASVRATGAKAPSATRDDWHRSESGIQRKGAELGMMARPSESWDQFKGRVWEELRKREGARA